MGWLNSFFGLGQPYKGQGGIDLYHSTTILVTFPVYPLEKITPIIITQMSHLPFQPQFGYTALNGSKTKWMQHDKVLFIDPNAIDEVHGIFLQTLCLTLAQEE